MPFPTSSKLAFRFVRVIFSITICLLISLFTLAQVTLKHRMLNGYSLSSDATVNKGKPTMFVFEQAETFGQTFKPPTNGKRPDRTDFTKEMIIGVALPPTNTPPQIAISKVFVQDSTLTVRYIRMTDTTAAKTPLSFTSQPTLLLAIPRQTVLKTRLVENGKVVQTIRKRDTGE